MPAGAAFCGRNLMMAAGIPAAEFHDVITRDGGDRSVPLNGLTVQDPLALLAARPGEDAFRHADVDLDNRDFMGKLVFPLVDHCLITGPVFLKSPQ